MASRLPTTTRPFDLSPTAWLRRAVVVLLALSLTGNPGVTGAVPSSTLLGGGLTLVLAAGLLWQQGWRPLPKVAAVAGLLAACALLSCMNSLAPYLSSLAAAALAGFVGVILVFELGISSRSQWREAAILLTLVSLGSALHGLYQWQIGDATSPVKSTFTNPDCYSIIPLVGVFLALGLALERGGLWRVFLAVALLPLVAALMLTASRAGLLGLGVGYFGFLFTLGSSKSKRLRKLALQLFLIPSLIGLIITGSGTSVQVLERFTRLSRGNDPVAVHSRWDVVRHGYKTILRTPLTGSGLGCFHLAYQQDRSVISAGEDYMNVAHNDYIQWLVETGIPGGLCWIGLLLISLGTAWRSYSSPTPWVAAQVATGLGIGTYCLLNFACPVPADLLWIGASLGLSGSLARLSQDSPRLSWSPGLFPPVLLLVAWGGWAFYWGTGCLAVQRTEIQVAQLESVLDWEGAIVQVQSALRRQPQNYNLELKRAELCKKAFVFSGQPHWLEEQAQALQKAYESSPRNLQVLLSQIYFLHEQEKPDQASAYVAEAEAVAPYSPYVYRARARNQILLGQLDQAATTLASIERTGRSVDDGALAILIYLLEAKGPDQGSAFLRKVAAQDPDRAADLGLRAAAEARKNNDLASAERLLARLRYLAPKRTDVALELALTRGADGDKVRELSTLDKLRRDANVELDDAQLEKVWRRWSELQVEKGELDLVLTQLDDYLVTHQRLKWPRQVMAQIYLKRDQKAEARGVLREGLAYDEDGSLRLQLGDMCASQGLKELARSYYREALRFSPQKAQIEARLLHSDPDQLEQDADQI